MSRYSGTEYIRLIADVDEIVIALLPLECVNEVVEAFCCLALAYPR